MLRPLCILYPLDKISVNLRSDLDVVKTGKIPAYSGNGTRAVQAVGSNFSDCVIYIGLYTSQFAFPLKCV
jgi:hypothetical protein